MVQDVLTSESAIGGSIFVEWWHSDLLIWLNCLCSGILEINCSKDVKVQGIIGPCTSLEKKSPLSSDTVIGQGNTSAWKMCGLDKKNITLLCI